MHVQRFQDSNERRDWQLVPQVIYFVNKCEAMFYTVTSTWIKFLLETSTVKPTIIDPKARAFQVKRG